MNRLRTIAALLATAALAVACSTGGTPGVQQPVVDRAALTVQDNASVFAVHPVAPIMGRQRDWDFVPLRAAG